MDDFGLVEPITVSARALSQESPTLPTALHAFAMVNSLTD